MFTDKLVSQCPDYHGPSISRLVTILFTGFVCISVEAKCNTSIGIETGDSLSMQDTVFIRKGRYKLSKHKIITIPNDTFYVTTKKIITPDDVSYQNSKIFYDTIYKKFSRKKFTQLLYYLAFVAPKLSDLPDSTQVLKSVSTFEKFRGKIIREIKVNVLSPFGSNIYDTGRYAVTGIGKALNEVHIDTRKYVLRKNLLFKKGDRVIPSLLADNERLLRSLPAVDNARIIVTQPLKDSDSVDVVVIAKDVWSIGIDIPQVTAQQVRFRIYDANFVGMGNQLTTKMSSNLSRSPFYLFEGLSYTITNIEGTMIKGTSGYTNDNLGNKSLYLQFDKSFVTNLTKYAGGASVSWETNIDEKADGPGITTRFNKQELWLGRAFMLNHQKEPPRAIVAVGLYRRDYTSRPMVTIDSNRIYYNQLQVLTSLSFSRNYYYLTDYVVDFGKIENLPYGQLFQVTAGLDRRDFYTRLYSGIHCSAGNFFNKFGYISADVKVGGFFNHDSFEDAVVKITFNYFTPLLTTPDSRYKFREFLTTGYRFAFNSRSNNRDYYDANLNFRVKKVSNENYFNGEDVLTGKISSVCFMPWYIYGFRFALMVSFQTGLVAQMNEPIFNAPLFSSAGLSIIIKNSNLVFPAFLLSGYFYPSTHEKFRQLQFEFSSGLRTQYDDFNGGAPHEENLGN